MTGGKELLDVAHEYLDPVRRARRRHAGPRLHALPAADRRHLLRHGRRRHAGVLGRGDRQGRLPGARRRATCCAPTTCRRPTTAFSTTGDPEEFRGLARRFLGPEVETVFGNLADRTPVAAALRGRVRVTVVGCSGSFAGPRVARVVLPRPGRARGPDLERRCSTSAAARWARCSGTSTRDDLDASCSATCTPTTASTCAVSTSSSATAPRASPSPLAVHGPTGTGEADARGLRPRRRARHGQPSSTSATSSTGEPVVVGPFTVTPYAVNHPVEAYGYRVEADGRCLAYTGDTDELRRPAPPDARRRPGPRATRRSSTGRDTVPGIHLYGARAPQAATRAGGVGRLDAHPHPRVERPRACAAPRRRPYWPGEVELAEPGADTFCTSS